MEGLNVSGNIIRTNEFAQLVKISELCTSPSEFLSYPGVKRLIKQVFNRGDIEQSFSTFVKLLINTRKDFDDNARIDLMYLLGAPSILSIKSYRNYLRVKANSEWENYKENSGELYTELSRKIMQYLENYDLDEALRFFRKEIAEICSVTKKSPDYIMSVLKKYKYAYESKDMSSLSAATGSIKGLFKEFNSKAKNKFIQEYIDNNISSIADKFVLVNEPVNDNKGICYDALQVLLGSQRVRSKVRMHIHDNYDVLLEADELHQFITNVIVGEDERNLKKLGLYVTPRMLLLDSTRAFNRLNSNYMPQFREIFTINQLDLVNSYLNLDDIEERRKLEKFFTGRQKHLLNEMRPILKKAHSDICVSNDKFVVNSRVMVLDSVEESAAKKDRAIYDSYYKIANSIHKAYETSKATIWDIGNSVNANQDDDSFTDDNFALANLDYLMDLDSYAQIIEMIDSSKLPLLLNDRDSLKALKNLFIDEGLISCFLCDGQDVEMIGKLINRMPQINKGAVSDDFTTNNLISIFKRADLCQYIDDFTLALLGEETAEKIVYNFQFLQGKNTPEKIAERLHKARYLSIATEGIDTSAVPYFDPIEVDGLVMKRYDNNDPKVLTSGIDSNTCFKIGANDNDYLFYSLLNRHGMVAYFEEDGKMCGRVTAHIRNNCLLINGIRNVENSYTASSVEQKRQNDKIIEVMKKFGEKMIELTSDSDCPIDFVIANKSGILESSDYDGTFPLTWDDCLLKYVDTYGDDFEEFRKINDEDPTLLQEVPFFEQKDKQPFTTDFGHYQLVMIASRDGRGLNSPRDVSYSSPDAIYRRKDPKRVIECGIIPKELLDRIRRIDALSYYFAGNDPKDYVLPDYEGIDFDIIQVGKNNYSLYADDMEVSAGFGSESSARKSIRDKEGVRIYTKPFNRIKPSN